MFLKWHALSLKIVSVSLEIYISHFRQFLGWKANEDGVVISGEEERIHPVQPPQFTYGWETQEQLFYLSDPELHSSFVAMCVGKKIQELFISSPVSGATDKNLVLLNQMHLDLKSASNTWT